MYIMNPVTICDWILFYYCYLSTDIVYFLINIDYFQKKVIINKIKGMCAFHEQILKS